MKVIPCNRFLIGRRLRIFMAAADRIVPMDGVSPGAGTPETAAVADWALGRLAPDLRRRFLIFLFLLDVLGIFFGGRPFSNNRPADRDRQLRWMSRSRLRPLRMGVFGLKSYVCMGYYTREPVWKIIGYGGPLEPWRTYPDPDIRSLCRRSPGRTP